MHIGERKKKLSLMNFCNEQESQPMCIPILCPVFAGSVSITALTKINPLLNVSELKHFKLHVSCLDYTVEKTGGLSPHPLVPPSPR